MRRFFITVRDYEFLNNECRDLVLLATSNMQNCLNGEPCNNHNETCAVVFQMNDDAKIKFRKKQWSEANSSYHEVPNKLFVKGGKNNFIALSCDQNLLAEMKYDGVPVSVGCTESGTTKSAVFNVPDYLPLNSQIKTSITISAEELLQLCEERLRCPNNLNAIFDEKAVCFEPPVLRRQELSQTELAMETPIVDVESADMAFGEALKTLCENSPIVLIRNMTSVLKLDLDIFSTESMLEFPDHEVELRTQSMPSTSECNFDSRGKVTWRYRSIPSKTTLKKFAQFQMQNHQIHLQEKHQTYDDNLESLVNMEDKSIKRPRFAPQCIKPGQTIKFGTNVDLADRRKFRKQLDELTKLPTFLQLEDDSNMLSYLGYDVVGMNTVQFYMKVTGVRTPGHLENNCLASVNINIGPDDCEWFGVDYAYLAAVNKMLEMRKIKLLSDSWWPDYKELLKAGVPVFRFLQRKGDIVWVGSGCIHWVQSTGCCNNIAWNVGPLNARQYELLILSHEWNRTQKFMSLVPVQHLSWRLAECAKITDEKLFQMIRKTLIRSLAYCKMATDAVIASLKEIKKHPRYDGDNALFCAKCEVEVWNLFFVKCENGKYVVYCLHCAREIGLSSFIALQQYSFEELSVIFDNFKLEEFTATSKVIDLGSGSASQRFLSGYYKPNRENYLTLDCGSFTL